MGPRKVLDSVGLFDKRYYLYLEDLDLCVRARKRGWKILYQPLSKLWHKNAASSSGPGNPLHEYYFTRNRLLFGMQYASLRTKAALLKETINKLSNGSDLEKKALKDALFFRFGERFVWEK